MSGTSYQKGVSYTRATTYTHTWILPVVETQSLFYLILTVNCLSPSTHESFFMVWSSGRKLLCCRSFIHQSDFWKRSDHRARKSLNTSTSEKSERVKTIWFGRLARLEITFRSRKHHLYWPEFTTSAKKTLQIPPFQMITCQRRDPSVWNLNLRALTPPFPENPPLPSHLFFFFFYLWKREPP